MSQPLTCPNCGAPLQIESAFTTFLVCSYCGQSLAVQATGVALAGQTAKLADYPSRLSVGAQGQIKGRGFKTLGRVRYENEDGFWDELFLQMADQHVGWLVEEEGVLTLVFKTVLTTPVPPFEQVRVGGFITIGPGPQMFVSEKGQAQVAGAEGQLATAAPPGHAIRFIEGSASSKAFRLVIDDQGLSLHTGEPLEFDDVVMAG